MQRARMRRLLMMGTLLLLPPVVSAVPGPVGSEFQVNTYTTDDQFSPAVAFDGAGNFVVVWESVQGGSGLGIFGQRYDSAGTPQGAEFQVNTDTSGGLFPAVAADPAGNFVVAWQSPSGSSYDTYEVFGQRFDSTGTAQGPEFQVNTYTTGKQFRPAVGTDAVGNFVVVWTSGTPTVFGGGNSQDGSGTGIFGQRYDNTGLPIGSEFQVNTQTTNNQSDPSVTADPMGNFVVVWQSDIRSIYDNDIFGQRYDSAGTPQGSEFQVNTYTPTHQISPHVVADGAGNFVVVWNGFVAGGGVFAQRYDATGLPVGSEFQVNAYTGAGGEHPTVATDGAGNFVVAWNSYRQDGSNYGVFAQRYDSSGTPQGSEFQVNTYTPSFQAGPTMAADAAGNFVVLWTSYGQDGNRNGVFGQRYDSTGAAVPGQVPIGGTSLTLTDRSATRRRVTLRSTDPSLANGINLAINPVATGAFLHVFNNAASGDSACFSLPAAGWIGVNLGKAIYRYSDPSFANGPCNRVTIKRGRLLRASCRSSVQPIPYSLDEAMQGSVGVNLTIGPATYCAVFGGTITADSGATGQFRASNAPAPTSCPTPPASCP